MNKKILSIFISLLLIISLSACKAFNKTEARWSQWYDQGDGTHARYSLDNIEKREVEPHEFDINQVVAEATDTKEGKIEHKCSKCGYSYAEDIPMTGGTIFDQEVVDEKYLYLKINEYTSYYYKSSIDGKFGNPNYIFKHTIIPQGFESVSAILTNGKQYIETPYLLDQNNYIQYNTKDGFLKTPNDYVRLDYITTGLNQYITLDYIPSITDTIEVSFTLLSIKNANCIFSSREDLDKNSMTFFVLSGGKKGRSDYGSEHKEFEYEFETNTKYTLKYGNLETYLNDELVATNTEAEFEPNYKMTIGCSNVGGTTYNNFANMHIYEYVIRDKDGKAIHDLVPVYSLEECAAGLYDIIDNRFYRSEGIDYIYDTSIVERSMSIDQFYISSSLERSKFIESNGTQYIDTKINTDKDIEIVCDFEAIKASTNNCIIPFGYRYLDSKVDSAIQPSLGLGGDRTSRFGSGSFTANEKVKLNLGTKYQVKINQNGLYLNNNLIGQFSNVGEFTHPGSIYIFKENGMPDEYNDSSLKFYSMKIYKAGVLIKNYIPVYNREFKKYGLYDLVGREELYPEGGVLTGERYDYYGQYLEFTGKNEQVNTYVKEDVELAQYIESNGNQQINTGLIFNPATDSIICDFESTVQNQNGMIIASAQAENYFWFYHYAAGSQITVYNGVNSSQKKVGGRAIDLNRHTMSYSNKSYYVDGILLGTDSRNLNACDNELYISSWGNNYFYSGKIYSIKIYRGQYLVRDYIPIYNKALNKYGLYDRVEEKEYYSDTNSQYAGQRYGMTEDYSMYDMSEIIKKIKEAGLDQVYDLAEYIESTGTQYINTGYVIDQNTLIETELMFTDAFSYNMMYGAWGVFSMALVDKDILCVSSGTTSTQNIGLKVQTDTKYKIIHSPAGVMINGNAVSFGNGVNSNPADRTLLLFASSDVTTGNTPYSWKSYGVGKIYGFKIYEGTELVHYYIPIYNKLTNEYGLYDVFTNTDYYSLGEDKFEGKIASNSYINTSTIIPTYLSLADYIESDGNEYIDTGLTVDENTDVRLDTMFTEVSNTYQGVYGYMAISLRGKTTVSDYTYGSQASHTFENKANTRYVVEWRKSNHGLFIDNNLVYSRETPGKAKDTTFYLFAVSGYQSSLRSAKARVYSFKAWKEDTLVRYMVPIYNNQTNMYGMYDLVEGKEYYSETENTFTGKLSEASSTNTTINIPGYLTLADHITFTGAQVIDSEIKQLTAYNFVITIDYKRSDVNDDDMCLFGQRQFGKFTNIYRGYFESAYGNTAAGTAKDTDRHIVVMDNKGLYLDGTSLITNNIQLVKSEYGALIGAFSEDDYTHAKWFYKGNIYSIKILDSGYCIKSFIPIYNNLTNDYGLYDIVGEKEYYSISGTKLQGALISQHDSTLPTYLDKAEYIESTGSQYIDTGYYPILDKTKVEVDACKDVNRSIFGSGSSNFTFTGGEGQHYAYYNGSSPMYAGSTVTDRHLFILDKNEVYVDSTLYETATLASGTVPYTLYLFARNIDGVDDGGSHKLYGCKIYEDDVLIRDFTPIYNKLTNSYGLYDLVEGKEYYSATDEGFLGSISNTVKLPEHLKFAEYIESMGGEYIELPSSLNCDFFELEAQYKEAENESTLIGNFDNGSSQRWELFTYPQSKTYNIWSANKSTIISDVDATLKAKISYNYKTGKFIVNQKEYKFGVLETQPRYLLQYGNNELYSKARLYYAKFIKDSEVVLNLIPVYNIILSKYGLYDTISGSEFYSSSSSSFIGALKDSSNSLLNLPDYIEVADYIKFTGSQTIDTLVTGGATFTFDLKWMPSTQRELMGYGSTSAEYFGLSKDGYYAIYNKSSVKAGNRDLVQFRYDETEAGVWVNGKKVIPINEYFENNTINSFKIGSLNGGYFASNLIIYDITCVQENETVRHFIPIYNKLTNEYGLYDLIEGKEYYSTTDTALVGARTTSSTIKVSSENTSLFVYKGETFKSKCSGVVIYDKDGNLLSNYAPVRRLSDGAIGFIDLVTNEFYLDQNGESFKYETVSLPIESEKVVKEPTYSEDGLKEIKYVGIDEKKYERIDKLSYLVTFTHSNKFEIRIYNTTNISDGFEITDSVYSRNQYTFNYSKVNAFVMFEVVSYYGDAYKIGGRAVNIKDNIYIIYNIDSDMDISIIE